MGIAESIKRARERGFKDEKILEEIIRENPSKKEGLEKALKRGVSHTQILEEIIEQNKAEEPEGTETRISKAKERLKSLKSKTEKKIKETAPVPPPKEEPSPAPSLSFKRPSPKKEAEKKAPKPAEKPREEKAPPFVRPLPKKPSLREKLWVRIVVFCLILVVLAGTASFWYWYFKVRPEPSIGCGADSDCPAGFVCGSEGLCKEAPPLQQCSKDADCDAGFYCSEGVCLKEKEEIAAPLALFPVSEKRTLEIASLNEVEDLLSQTFQEFLDTGTFKRIIFKNTSEDKFLGIKDFFGALEIRVPDNIYPVIEDDFNLFVYSQPQGNRIGFVVEVKDKENLENILLSRESSLKEDFKPLFSLMIEDKPPVVSYFRNAGQLPGYVGHNFRYQTLNRNDVGICYLVSNNYFIFTSSYNSMEQAIEKLGIPGPTVELTKDLEYGDRGYEVEVLQTWLAQDAAVYSRGLVTGYYGPLTTQAVTKFQEKYASEVLAPQGRVKGTGKAGEYTRVKLNELYGESGAIPLRPEITKDLRYGDHGDEVRLLQKWLAQEPNVYEEKIISGWFGPLTQRAVINFQNKYKSEILDPQGLSEGSGIVDSWTKKKLNELYGR